jgi:hypothetical protein
MIEVRWPSMGVDEWAAYERRVNRTPLIRIHGTWWRSVRSLFFRPLNLMASYPATIQGPRLGSCLGAIQFPVEPSVSADSFIRLIIDQNPGAYGLSQLVPNVQRDIRKGNRRFEIRVIDRAEVVVTGGYSVYREFQVRTGYQHLVERLEPALFEQWVRRLFEFQNLRVLGAFSENTLSAVAITFRVGDSVHYSSYFGNEFSLGSCASDCMLHAVRTAAAADPGVKRVYTAGAGMPRGLDNFYLRRGFGMVDQPAMIRGNRLTLSLLKHCAPAAYRKMFGTPAEPETPHSDNAHAPMDPGVEVK